MSGFYWGLSRLSGESARTLCVTVEPLLLTTALGLTEYIIIVVVAGLAFGVARIAGIGRRRLRIHEALIVAVQDIWERQSEVRRAGVGSDQLAYHRLTRKMDDLDVERAVELARGARWLMDDDRLHTNSDGKWHGLRLSHEGLDKVAELRRPSWQRTGGFLGTIVVPLVVSVASAVLSALLLRLLLSD